MNNANAIYPLKQVLEVKIRRVEDQEKVVKEKKDNLAREEDKLRQKEAERDKVLNHHNDKLKQLRDTMDAGTTSPKIQQMKAYIKVVKERLKAEEKKVKDQKELVAQAEKQLQQAIDDLKAKRIEVDKLKTHQVDWEKAMRKELEVIEGREQDELGNTIFLGKIIQKRQSRL